MKHKTNAVAVFCAVVLMCVSALLLVPITARAQTNVDVGSFNGLQTAISDYGSKTAEFNITVNPVVFTEPAVTVSSAAGRPGEQVEVTVSLENNPGIVEFGLVLQYDDTRLKYITAKAGDILTNGFRDDWRLSGSTNQLRFKAYDPDGKAHYEGNTLFTVTFEILDGTGTGVINGGGLLFSYLDSRYDGIFLIDGEKYYDISQGEIKVIPDRSRATKPISGLPE